MNNNENINTVNVLDTQNNNVQPLTPTIDQPQQENTPTDETVNIEQNNIQQTSIQNGLQNIPTVEQDKNAFINNIESMSAEKKEEKKEGINFVFIIIMFVIILVAIIFLFPFLLDHI